jgi:chromosome segregation ATPase
METLVAEREVEAARRVVEAQAIEADVEVRRRQLDEALHDLERRELELEAVAEAVARGEQQARGVAARAAELERREVELTAIAESLALRRQEQRRSEETAAEELERLDRRGADLDRRAADLKRRELGLDVAEAEIERRREALSQAAVEATSLDPAGEESPVTGWLDRRRRRAPDTDERLAELDRREEDLRRLEERMRALEGALTQKEADLTAFAASVQRSVARSEGSAVVDGRARRPGDEDPTQRLRFWTRDSAAPPRSPRD